MGLGPARVGVGGAARESIFRSSVRAVSRIEVSRPEIDTPSREESNRGGQRIQNEAPAEKTGDKNPLRDGKRIAARRNRAETRAPARVSQLRFSCRVLFRPFGAETRRNWTPGIP